MPKIVIISKFENHDAEPVCKLVRKVFLAHNAKGFTKKGIAKFLSDITPQKEIARAKSRSRKIYVAKEGKKIVGTVRAILGKRPLIGLLYVDSERHRQGIGKKLLSTAEQWLKRQNAKKIAVRSSLFAQDFYSKNGYKKVRGIIKKHGMVYQPMQKNL